MSKKPAQPNAFAVHRIHTVVPVAAAEKQQSVQTSATAQNALYGTLGVQENALRDPAFGGMLVAVGLGGVERRRVYITYNAVADRNVARLFDILAQRPNEPQKIVGAACADALVAVGQRVPPVHDVALKVLMRAGEEYLLFGDLRVKKYEIYSILKLISKADCAAALIDRAAPKHSAGVGLIQSPAVHIAVERIISAFHPEHGQQLAPVSAAILKCLESGVEFT